MKRRPSIRRLLLALALVLAVLVVPSAGRASADENDMVRITIGDDRIDMEDFLAAVSAVTKTRFLWDPKDRTIMYGRLRGSLDLSLPQGQVLQAIRALLKFYSLVTIPVGPPEHRMYLVLDPRNSSTLRKLKPEFVHLTPANLQTYASQDGRYITTAIHLEHLADATAVRSALSYLATGQNIGSVVSVPGANTIVVTDFAPNVVAAYRLLESLDRPSTGSTTTSSKTVGVWLEHAQAVEVAAVLNRHFAVKAPTRRPAQQGAPSRPSIAPRITADARTNQVLLSGTAALIRKVKSVIRKLDVPVRAQATRSTHLIRLTNIESDEAAGALMDLIVSASSAFTTPGRPVVIAHRETNALVVSATDADHRRLRKLIAEMDKAP